MIEQEVCEWRDLRAVLVIHPEVRLRHNCREQRGVPTESVTIDGGLRVDIHSTVKQPPRNLDLVVVGTHVKQSRAGERRPVRREDLVVTPQLRRVDLVVRERPLQQNRIAAQMLLLQVVSPYRKIVVT